LFCSFRHCFFFLFLGSKFKPCNAIYTELFTPPQLDNSLCVNCGNIPRLPGHILCQDCDDHVKESLTNYKRILRDEVHEFHPARSNLLRLLHNLEHPEFYGRCMKCAQMGRDNLLRSLKT
jgi:hypothetical protein